MHVSDTSQDAEAAVREAKKQELREAAMEGVRQASAASVDGWASDPEVWWDGLLTQAEVWDEWCMCSSLIHWGEAYVIM